MLNREEIILYLDGALPPEERARISTLLASEPAAQEEVLHQERISRGLQALLALTTEQERVKQSILSVIRAMSHSELKAKVLAEMAHDESRPLPKELPSLRALFIALKSRWSAPAFALSVLLAAAIGWWIIDWHNLPPEIGRVIATVGSPTIRSVEGKRAVELPASTSVRFGDRLETGDADKAELRFTDGTSLQLHFNTAIELPKPLKAKITFSRPPEIRLLHGQVWTKVQKATNATEYAIKTDIAVAVARGTEFGLKFRPLTAFTTNSLSLPPKPQLPSEALLTVKEGTVEFFNTFGSVKANAMHESTVRAGFAPTEPKRLQTVQQASTSGSEAVVISEPLTWQDAADKLAGVGGFAGLHHSGSPGEGLKPGDILLAVNGRTVTNAIGFCSEILLQGGLPRSVTVRRAGQEMTVPVQSLSRTNELAPALSPDAVSKLAVLMQRWIEPVSLSTNLATERPSIEKVRTQQALQIAASSSLRAAACNNLGVLFELEDELGPAVRAYGRAVSLDPATPLYRFNLGKALRSIGSFERASEEFDAVARVAPTSIPVQIARAFVRSLLGDHSDALTQTEAVLKTATGHHGAWELKARLLAFQKRNVEALEAARTAAELESNCAVAQGYLGLALKFNGNLDESEQAFRRAIELSPSDATHYFNLGSLQESRGQYELAEKSYRKAIELRPYVWPYSNLSHLLGRRKAWGEAEAILEKAAQLFPEDLEVVQASARLAMRRGFAAVEEGLLEDGEKHFRKALEMCPADPDAEAALAKVISMRAHQPEVERLLDLGEALRREGKLDEATQAFRKVQELVPENASAMNRLGIIHGMRGELAEAEKAFRQLVDLFPSDVAFLSNLARACAGQNKLAEAEKYSRRLFVLQPDDPENLNNLAWYLAELNTNLDEALALARHAVAAVPENPNYLDTAGWVHFRRGELDEAAKVLTQGLSIAGETPLATEIRKHLQNVQEAKKLKPE